MIVFVVPDEAKRIYEELLPDDIKGRELLLVAAGEKEDKGLNVTGITAFEPISAGAWELSYIHVAEKNRKKGLAGLMLSCGAETIRALGGDAIYASYLRDDESKELDRCLENAHFLTESESSVCKASIEEFAEGVKAFEVFSDKKNDIIPLSKADDALWNELNDVIDDLSDKADDKEIYPALFEKEAYLLDVSMIAKKEGVKGAILFEKTGDDLTLGYIWATRSAGFILGDLMRSSLDVLLKDYPASTMINYHGANPVADRIAKRILKKDPIHAGDAVVLKRDL